MQNGRHTTNETRRNNKFNPKIRPENNNAFVPIIIVNPPEPHTKALNEISIINLKYFYNALCSVN